jgi:hypothetical protein
VATCTLLLFFTCKSFWIIGWHPDQQIACIIFLMSGDCNTTTYYSLPSLLWGSKLIIWHTYQCYEISIVGKATHTHTQLYQFGLEKEHWIFFIFRKRWFTGDLNLMRFSEMKMFSSCLCDETQPNKFAIHLIVY